LSSVVGELGLKFGAEFGRLETALNSVPGVSVVDSVLKPIGVVTEPVLLVASVGKDLTSTLVGDNEGEDGEGEKKEYEEEHDEEVEPEET